MNKKLMGVALGVSLVLAGCAQTDVIAKYAVSSFDEIIKQSGANVFLDEANNGWALQSTGGEQFMWGVDFEILDKPDLMMSFDAKPFLAAGLDPLKLDKEMYEYDATKEILMIHSEVGADRFTYKGEAKPIESFKQLVASHRDRIGYHEALDHYGVKLGDGNMFEWAKDMKKNDKDIVFVLNPKPLMDAGLNPSDVKGWVFAQVEIINDQGSKELVDKLLKPYDFK